MPTNLADKLSKDLKVIFKIKKDLNLQEIIKEINFAIPVNSENELINYFDEISKKLDIKNEYISEIKEVFKTNLDKLKKNILSRHFYNIFIYKIGKHFRKKFEDELKKNLELLNKS